MKQLKSFSILILAVLIISGCSIYSDRIEPEEQFVQVLYRYNFRNELNTFENTYQKDLVMGGVIKVEFWLTSDEQQAILEKAKAIDFLSLPTQFMREGPIQIVPSSTSALRIKSEMGEHSVMWNYLPQENRTEEYNSLREFGDLIKEIIESKPEYKRLPPPKGGYF